MVIRLWSLGAIALLLALSNPVAAETDAPSVPACGDPADPDLRIQACTALLQSGGQTPENILAALINRGEAYDSKRDYNQAIGDYSAALAIRPDFGPAYVHRCLTYTEQGDNDRAIADCDAALKLDPGDPAALLNRGIARYAKGNTDQAIEDWTQAIAIDPMSALAYSSRCMARVDRGEDDAAIADCDLPCELTRIFRQPWCIAVMHIWRKERPIGRSPISIARLRWIRASLLPGPTGAWRILHCSTTRTQFATAIKRRHWIPAPTTRSLPAARLILAAAISTMRSRISIRPCGSIRPRRPPC